MLEKVFGYLFILSIGMVVFGIEEFFTATYPEKWYPCMSYRFFTLIPFLPLSDKVALKLVFWGIVLFLFTVIAGAILSNLGILVYD